MSNEALSDLKKAQNNIWRLLKIRPRSEKELKDQLIKKNFSEEIIDQTIQYFKTLDLVDDRLFAQKWVLSRLNKPFGFNRIRFELKTKGIAENIIHEELNKVKRDFAEEETVLKLVKIRSAKYKDIDREKMKNRVYGYLARRGFSNENILKALKQI